MADIEKVENVILRGPPFLHAELHAHAIPQRTLGDDGDSARQRTH